MRHTVLVGFVILAALSAGANTITSIQPKAATAGGGEFVATIHGSSLGSRVIFSGPAGEFAVEADTGDKSALEVWVPLKVTETVGRHSVVVTDGRTTSAPVYLEIYPHPFVLLVPDPVTKEADGPKGARVTYEVWPYGGRDPNPRVTCDRPSGSLFPLGATTVTCVATNSFGERTEGHVFIYVYDTGIPVLRLPGDIKVDADGPDGTIVRYEVSAGDAVDGEVPASCSPESGSRFPIGVTVVVCTATDSAQNTAYDSFQVEVVGEKEEEENPDEGKLVIHVPANITAEATAANGATVTFEVTADGTSDPRPQITCNPSSGSTFPFGTTTVVCVASDRFGNSASGSFTVTVGDTVAPLIRNITASPDTLEPPNHKLVPVTITVEVSDAMDPMPRCAIMDVTANQAVDDDVVYKGDLELELRAERLGGAERVYAIDVECTDASQNSARGRVVVIVPKGPTADQQEATVPEVSKRRSAGRG